MNTTTVCRLSSLFDVLCSALCLPLAAGAQPPEGAERGSIMLGAFISDHDSRARLDSDSGEGTDVDLEDDLGLRSATNVARIGTYVWLNRRHRFDAAYFDLSRTSEAPIQETIDFGDETFTLNSVIETEADLSIIKADYTFAALARDRGFLGVTAGLHVADIGFALRERTLGRSESEDLTAPLPLLGLRGDFAVSDRFTLRGAVQWFSFETEDVDGDLTDLYFGGDYRLGERMAVGLAYNRMSMDIRAQEDDAFTGRLDWRYDGLLLYLKCDFGSRH